MDSGSSGRENKAYGFASNDILCSYEDYGTQEASNIGHSVAPTHDHQDFCVGNKTRTIHSVMSTVENNMKKQTDNIMRFLEGISSRLSQLELHCYNLDKSIGEMRSDIVRGHEESDSKLKSLDKHFQEVHRSVQILRDKQELADTQKELAKLQLAEKEPPSSNPPQQNEDRASNPATEAKQNDNSSYVHDQHLALVPHQQPPPPQPIEHQQTPIPPPSSMPQQGMPPAPAYYLLPSQTPNMSAPSQPSQTQYLPIMSQVQDPSRGGPPPPQQSQVNQAPHAQSAPSYQWLQNQPPQQPVMQQQIRNPSQIVYSNYLPNQPPAEMASNNMPMQAPYPGSSQAGAPGSESIQYGFAPSGPRPIQQQPPPTQHSKTGYGTPPGDSYIPSGARPGNAYVMFDGEGGRTQPPPQPHFQQNQYPPPSSFAMQNVQFPPSAHPYNELIEKLVSMGYRGENVIGVIRRLEESGQQIDFNSVLDRLNAHSGGGPPRGWSN